MSSLKFKQAPKLVCFISQSLIKFHQEGLLFQLRKSTFKFEKKKYIWIWLGVHVTIALIHKSVNGQFRTPLFPNMGLIYANLQPSLVAP